MKADFTFDGLFILDLANNHQGDVAHATRIVREAGRVVAETGVRAALKFQFRHLDTLIHPEYRNRSDVKHIPRFLSTALSRADFESLTEEVRRQGMITMATPFDEASVGMLLDLGIEVIKVASCSASDWPLLRCIAGARRPVVVSTAGLGIGKLDKLVSFLERANVSFALMHCVALYPTPRDRLNLNQITVLRDRYRNVPVGFSTHEDPGNFDAVRVAHARGARLFERHIGIQTETCPMNAYSSDPETVRKWILAWQDAVAMCGGDERAPAAVEEMASLRSLMRGVYAKAAVRKGATLARDDVFFAMPLSDGQLPSGSWREGLVADREYASGEPLAGDLAEDPVSGEQLVYEIMLMVRGMLNSAGVFVGRNSSVEISHHYGLERFREFGCVIVDVINRQYCKKILIMLPRQKHPYHYHARKEETFQLLSGDLEIVLDGRKARLMVGDTFLVPVNGWHKFHTLDGAIVEEVSTTHVDDDSFYEDERIARLPRSKRKTSIPNWEAALAGRA